WITYPKLQGREIYGISLDSFVRHKATFKDSMVAEYDIFPLDEPPVEAGSRPPSLALYVTPAPMYIVQSNVFVEPLQGSLRVYPIGNIRVDLQRRFCLDFVDLL